MVSLVNQTKGLEKKGNDQEVNIKGLIIIMKDITKKKTLLDKSFSLVSLKNVSSTVWTTCVLTKVLMEVSMYTVYGLPRMMIIVNP